MLASPDDDALRWGLTACTGQPRIVTLSTVRPLIVFALVLLAWPPVASASSPALRKVAADTPRALAKSLGMRLARTSKNPKAPIVAVELECADDRDDCDEGKQCWLMEDGKAWTIPSCPFQNGWSPDGQRLVMSGELMTGILIVGLKTLREMPEALWDSELPDGASYLRAPMPMGTSSDFTRFYGWEGPNKLKLGGGCCGTITFVTYDLASRAAKFGCSVYGPDSKGFNDCPKE